MFSWLAFQIGEVTAAFEAAKTEAASLNTRMEGLQCEAREFQGEVAQQVLKHFMFLICFLCLMFLSICFFVTYIV